MANFINTSYGYDYGNGGCISTLNLSGMGMGRDNRYDKPINEVEKDNKKILQYELIGLNESNITVKKNFVNKTKTLYVTVEGKYEDELTGWKNDINIKLDVDYNFYNKVTWFIKDGLLTMVLHEILNTEPEVELNKEIK